MVYQILQNFFNSAETINLSFDIGKKSGQMSLKTTSGFNPGMSFDISNYLKELSKKYPAVHKFVVNKVETAECFIDRVQKYETAKVRFKGGFEINYDSKLKKLMTPLGDVDL